MEAQTLIFYAVICGVLAGVAPVLGSKFIRIGVGAVVGILAALVLPYIKSNFGM